MIFIPVFANFQQMGIKNALFENFVMFYAPGRSLTELETTTI